MNALTSLRCMFSFSFWSKITSKWLTWDSASATRRVRSLSSSRLLDGKPLLCNISRSFLIDSSRALRVCFCVSILSSISSKVFLNRNSSLACLSCSACRRRKFSSVSSMVKCSAPRLPLSCCRRWLRSLWVLSSSWRAWIVNCRCCDKKDGAGEEKERKSQWKCQELFAGTTLWRWKVNHEVQRASCEVLQGDFRSMGRHMERGILIQWCFLNVLGEKKCTQTQKQYISVSHKENYVSTVWI